MTGKSGIVQIRNKFLIFFADNVGCGRRERSGSIQYIMLGNFIVFFPGGQGNALIRRNRIIKIQKLLYINAVRIDFFIPEIFVNIGDNVGNIGKIEGICIGMQIQHGIYSVIVTHKRSNPQHIAISQNAQKCFPVNGKKIATCPDTTEKKEQITDIDAVGTI